MFTHAITRKPGMNFAQGITTSGLGTPDYELMLGQHEAYVQALRSLGLEVIVLEPLPDFPDAYFVEDVAVVTPQVAVITRPGTAVRQGEEAFIEPVLAAFKPVAHIEPPGTLEGGDVLPVDDHFFIGLSRRTNEAGAKQLGRILEGQGYGWTANGVAATQRLRAVPVTTGLHLKSSVNYIGKNTLLLLPEYAAQPAFAAYHKMIVDDEERAAANSLLVNDQLLIPAGFPKTRQKVASLGFPIIELDMSETMKMDGGLTCLSLRF
jgi:dimethylargininase